ncbi:MAG: hypothetical protein JNJ56_04670 [Ignavibacteria bacterium]|nr:hypothetical protein [Ignavibacteria bacterium]
MSFSVKKKKEPRFAEIFKTFSETEIEEFKEFVSLPVFSKGRNYSEFLDKTGKFYSGNVTSENQVNERTHWNRLSELTVLAEKFLILKNLDKNKFSADMLLLDELRERNISNFGIQKFNSFFKDASAKPASIVKANELYGICSSIFAQDFITEKADLTYSQFDMRFVQFITGILVFRIREFYLIMAKEANQNPFRNEIINMQDFEIILPYIKNHLNEYYPLVSFYFYLYKSLVNINDTYNYHVARNILLNELNNVSKEVRSDLLNYIIDYNIYRLNSENNTSSRELFYFIDLKIREKILECDIRNDSQNFRFITIVMNALALKKISWAERFVKKFGKLLPVSGRDYGISLAGAYIAYYKNDFQTCKKIVDRMKSLNAYGYIDSAKLNMRVSFELGKFEESFDIKRRLEEFLRVRKNITEQYFITAKEFCTLFNLLLKLRGFPSKENLFKLEHELSKGSLSGKMWIMRKMKEIKVI